MISEELIRQQTESIIEAYKTLTGHLLSDMSVSDFLSVRQAAINEVNIGIYAERTEKPAISTPLDKHVEIPTKGAKIDVSVNSDKNIHNIVKAEKKTATRTPAGPAKVLSPFEELKQFKDEWN